MFGLGIWTVVDRSFVNELLGTNLFAGATYVLIATSALVCLVSFFGCLGAAKEVKCMLLTVRIYTDYNNIVANCRQINDCGNFSIHSIS